MSKKEKIEIIITGGTIDSCFDAVKDAIVPLEKSVIPDFVKSLKIDKDFDFTEVCMKDSRSLTKDDLENVRASIEKSEAGKIIITHGTYTMPDTARFLEANLKRKDQVIILTGSMTPLTGFSPSDAPFNLGHSLASLENAKPGIYVGMNGQLFNPKEVIKRISEGKFVSILNSN